MSRIRSLAERARRKIDEAGPAYALVLAMRWALDRVPFLGEAAGYTRIVLMELPLADDSPAEPEAPAATEWATTADFAVDAREVRLFQERLSRGDRVRIYTGGQARGHVWFRAGCFEDPDSRVRFALDRSRAWLFDAWVEASGRGSGIYPRMIREVKPALREHGFSRVLLSVEVRNANSVRAHEKVGASIVGSVSTLKLMGFCRVDTSWGDGPIWLKRGAWLEATPVDMGLDPA